MDDSFRSSCLSNSVMWGAYHPLENAVRPIAATRKMFMLSRSCASDLRRLAASCHKRPRFQDRVTKKLVSLSTRGSQSVARQLLGLRHRLPGLSNVVLPDGHTESAARNDPQAQP